MHYCDLNESIDVNLESIFFDSEGGWWREVCEGGGQFETMAMVKCKKLLHFRAYTSFSHLTHSSANPGLETASQTAHSPILSTWGNIEFFLFSTCQLRFWADIVDFPSWWVQHSAISSFNAWTAVYKLSLLQQEVHGKITALWRVGSTGLDFNPTRLKTFN